MIEILVVLVMVFRCIVHVMTNFIYHLHDLKQSHILRQISFLQKQKARLLVIILFCQKIRAS